MRRCESWVEFYRQHVESSFKLVLESDTLTQGWRKFELFHLSKLIVVNGLMHLCDPYLVFSSRLRRVHRDTCRISLLVPCHHRIFLYVKTIIEQNAAIYLFYDVIFYKNQPIYFYVNCKTIRVKTCGYFFIYFDKDVVCWLFYRSLTVFFGN
jgi:hypothetical protein